MEIRELSWKECRDSLIFHCSNCAGANLSLLVEERGSDGDPKSCTIRLRQSIEPFFPFFFAHSLDHRIFFEGFCPEPSFTVSILGKNHQELRLSSFGRTSPPQYLTNRVPLDRVMLVNIPREVGEFCSSFFLLGSRLLSEGKVNERDVDGSFLFFLKVFPMVGIKL